MISTSDHKIPIWEDIAHEAQLLRDQTLAEVGPAIALPMQLSGNVTNIPEEILSTESIRITNLSPEKLVHLASNGSISAQEIAQAFLERAVVAQKLTNCLTELLTQRAISHAIELDNHLLKYSLPLGPLHGLPVSIKSHIGIAHRPLASGYCALFHSFPRPVMDALVVQIITRAGAIVHARTTEPQSMMQLECASNLYGVTTNPYSHILLSSGGSSGGEGALIALRGSVLGIGSDVGGSIRVPAAACGIYGFKPTAFRVPTTGWSSTLPGADPVVTVLGPMSVNLEGIEMLMKVVAAAEPWLANFTAYKRDEGWAVVSSLYFTDGGEADITVMSKSGEPLLPLTKWIIKENPGVKNLSRDELEYWLEEREEFRTEYLQHWNKTGYWNEAEGKWTNTVDAIICPVAPGVATKHNTAKYWAYTAVWNLLDYPALAFPAGITDKTVDIKENRRKYMSGLDKDNWQLYDPEIFHQMPTGLQIIGRKFEDEKVIAILKFLEKNIYSS
ncbi:amidase [Trichoderma arundinaceum]|uniref:amidase n=1 Tax=Trichoderma arundinaceum TaxID=490622 RepID=A0A395NS14_TRIAR|nr:amidase [Trichoderma arundinaceum]